MTILITGAAGFIGHAVATALIERGHDVVGVDNLNDYYPTILKRKRLESLSGHSRFRFVELDVSDYERLVSLKALGDFTSVVHLAAQAGVRYSIERPFAYASSNLNGHLAVLEFCRNHKNPPRLVYASSSSVYGGSRDIPYTESQPVDSPYSLYAATKRADELMSMAYAKLYDLEQIGLRFFTVYGPWGRPDMAYWTFTEKILNGEPINIYNNGQHRRDFTYITDIVSGVIATIEGTPNFEGDRPHRIYNIGNSRPEELLDFITEIERATGKDAIRVMMPLQPGDVHETYADVSALEADYGYRPSTSLSEGIPQFVDWYRSNIHQTNWFVR